MKEWVRRADDVLRGRSTGHPWGYVMLCGFAYGAAMGCFGGIDGDRAWQVVFSAIKVPLLLTATLALSLPSFFVINTLTGLRRDFPEALQALLRGQAGLTVLLASFAPLTLLCNVTATTTQTAVLFSALMFGIATVGGQILLRRYYGTLVERDMRHYLLMRIWGVLYAFVGIQMGWILRPFVGDPHRPVAFFRAGFGENAYVALFQLIRHVFT